jgi:hypothetical protein
VGHSRRDQSAPATVARPILLRGSCCKLVSPLTKETGHELRWTNQLRKTAETPSLEPRVPAKHLGQPVPNRFPSLNKLSMLYCAT